MIDFGKRSYPRIKLKAQGFPTVYVATSRDAVSRALFGLKIHQVVQIAKDHGLNHLDKHFRKNAGHLRMIIGQSLRHLVLTGHPISVQGHVITDVKQKTPPWPNGYVEYPVNRVVKEAPKK